MSNPIIASLRTLRQLHESLLHTAQEIAHRASIYGVASVSLRYLAQKCHCCKQTIINHIKKLIELKILRKTVLWIKGNYCEINTYTFTISWPKGPAHMSNSQNSGQELPHQDRREKKFSLLEEMHLLRQGMKMLNPHSERYQSCLQELARLEALVDAGTNTYTQPCGKPQSPAIHTEDKP